MSRLSRFFAKPVSQGHEAGSRNARPWWRGFKALMLAGLVSLSMAAPAQAFTSDPFNPGNPMNMVNPLSPWCTVCDDGETMSWEDYRRVDAVKIQAAEQGITNPKDKRLVIDEARVEAYIADRVEERDTYDAAKTPEERWTLKALERQAREQGLPGWADDRFVEDRTKTRLYTEQNRQEAELVVNALLITLGVAGGVGGIGLIASSMSGNRRRYNVKRKDGAGPSGPAM